MIKLKDIIREIYDSLNGNESENSSITIKDVDNILNKKFVSRDVLRTLEILEEYYHSGNQEHNRWAVEYIELLNKVLQRALVIIKNLNIPFVDTKHLKGYLLGQTEFFSKEEQFFPFPLYISANQDAEDTIGILVDIHGKVIEIHEGNDESSPNTIALANKLVNPQGKPVRVFASHNRNLVFKIDEEDMLPANLYVSPDRKHAESHMDLKGERETFTCIIDINSINQESDLDWKTIGPTRIKSFKFL